MLSKVEVRQKQRMTGSRVQALLDGVLLNKVSSGRYKRRGPEAVDTTTDDDDAGGGENEDD